MVWDDTKVDDEGLTPAGRLLASEYNALVTAVKARVLESLFDANTILKADSDDTPAALTIAEQTLVGRITAGVITGLTATQVRTLLSVDNVENIKVNLIATVAPTVNDDSDDGYSVLSRWADITADKEYVCLDATVGAAVWTETTGSGGGSSTVNIFLPAEAAYLPQADFSLTGTVTMTNASTAVTGSGTAFDTELQVNDYIKLDADTSTSWAKVASIETATGLTLSAVYGGTGGASAASGSGNPAQFGELLGTGRYIGWSVAKFDDTLENPDGGERCGWRFFVPDYDGGNITLTGAMKPATTPTGAVTFILNIRTVGIATSEPFDNAITVDTGVNMTFSLNTTELDSDAVFATATINPANVATNDLMVLEVDIDPSSTLVGDAYLLYILAKYNKV